MEESRLMEMINAEFNTSKKQEDNEKVYFCVDCGGESLTNIEKEEEHDGHRVLKSYKASHFYGYRHTDILGLGSEVLDVSGVRPFAINTGFVYYPKTRSQGDSHIKNKGRATFCFGCGYFVGDPHLYCSILCKLSSPSPSGSNDGKVRNTGMNHLIMDQGDVGKDLQKKSKSKSRNKKRKGPVSPKIKKKRSVSPQCKKMKEAESVLVVVEDDLVKKKMMKEGLNVNVVVEDDSVKNNNNGEEEKMQGLLDAVQNQTISFRKRSRKGKPYRAPFF